MTILPFAGTARGPLWDALAVTLGPDYRIEGELRGGGMSRVFVAVQVALDRRVAVKVIAPELAAGVSLERFRREILVSAGLQHPHIVGVLSAGETDGLPYFIMPFIDGESVRQRLRDGPMPVGDVVRIMRDVARALEFAHARGVVHRDIKPDNILLASGAAMVTDFGVSKALSLAQAASAHGATSLTAVGMSLGTPAYMAPEQVAADPNTDHRADLYALGVTTYDMLAGEPPFRAETPQRLLVAQLTERPRALREHRSDVSEVLEALILRCMEKLPDDRPQTAAAIVAALDDPAIMSGDLMARTMPPAKQGHQRRLRYQFVAAAALAVGGATLGIRMFVARAGAIVDPRSVAVLPVADLSEDSADAKGARALTAEIRSALGRIEGMRVAAPQTSAASGNDMASEDVGRRLHVAAVLESTLQREGRRLRLSVRLVGSDDGLSRWADVFEGDASSLLDVQRRLTEAIVRGVQEAMPAAASAADRGPANVAPPSTASHR